MKVKPAPPTRQQNLSLHLAAAELPPELFNRWLSDPKFQETFRLVHGETRAVFEEAEQNFDRFLQRQNSASYYAPSIWQRLVGHARLFARTWACPARRAA